MSLNHTDINSTAANNVAHSKRFSISFCNIRGLYSNLSSVHQHLQSSNPHAFFLTETKLRPLDPSNTSILSPNLKCPGYELFSSFFPNCGVCAFIHSDVQTSLLTQFDLSNPGFKLIWLKFPLLVLLNSFALYTANQIQIIMTFYLTIYLHQLMLLLFNFHVLKSLSLVISMSTIQNGLFTLLTVLTQLVVMQRPLPL